MTARIVTAGVLSAILLVGQVGMSFLPNIEPVSTLIILYTLTYKKRVFPVIYTFVLLEGVLFGFGIWWISYLYIWSILALVALAFQKLDSAILWAVVSGSFGLLFGALCAIPYLISGGPGAAFAYGHRTVSMHFSYFMKLFRDRPGRMYSEDSGLHEWKFWFCKTDTLFPSPP